MTNTGLISKSLVELLKQLAVRHEVHTFSSGAIMVDIWYKDHFYVLQFDEGLIGLSEITDENSGFDTVPDEKFYDTKEVMERVRSLLSLD